MSSHLHVYVGPFIESPYPAGDGDPFDIFERKHDGALSYHRLGVTLLSAFKSAYWAEIETVCALISGAGVRFGVVAYYL